MRFSFFLPVVFLLNACQSVQDQSIPLDSNFFQQALMLEIKRPSWRLTDKVYHQQYGNFAVVGADVGAARFERNQLWIRESGAAINGIGIEDRLLRFIFLDVLDLGAKTERQFQLRGERDFAFTANIDSKHATTSRCRLLTLDEHLLVDRISANAAAVLPSRSSHQQRQITYLGCEITQGEMVWQLMMHVDGKNMPRLRLTKTPTSLESGQTQTYAFNQLTDSLYLVDHQWRQVPNMKAFGPIMSGITILSSTQNGGHPDQIAALSFDGDTPKIWLNKQLAPERQVFMAAVSYSLLMSDWLDDAWRSSMGKSDVNAQPGRNKKDK
jgi:hypothetical protein